MPTPLGFDLVAVLGDGWAPETETGDGDGKGASMDSVKQVSRQHIKLAPLPLEKKGMQ